MSDILAATCAAVQPGFDLNRSQNCCSQSRFSGFVRQPLISAVNLKLKLLNNCNASDSEFTLYSLKGKERSMNSQKMEYQVTQILQTELAYSVFLGTTIPKLFFTCKS